MTVVFGNEKWKSKKHDVSTFPQGMSPITPVTCHLSQQQQQQQQDQQPLQPLKPLQQQKPLQTTKEQLFLQ